MVGNVAPFSRMNIQGDLLVVRGVEAEDHESLVFVLHIKFLEMTHLLAAGRSPGPPDVEPDDLAAIVRELDPLPVGRGQIEVRRFRARFQKPFLRAGIFHCVQPSGGFQANIVSGISAFKVTADHSSLIIEIVTHPHDFLQLPRKMIALWRARETSFAGAS